jgi:hypothetical protein
LDQGASGPPRVKFIRPLLMDSTSGVAAKDYLNPSAHAVAKNPEISREATSFPM